MIRTAKLALTAPIAGLAVLAGVLLGVVAGQAQEAAHTTVSASSVTPPVHGPLDTHW